MAKARTGDEWVRAAMTDDTVVAEFLMRLKEFCASPPTKVVDLPAPPPGWGLRQPRSRPFFSASDSRRKEATRRSPTTPLSWSGGGSPSATADGVEESSSGRRSSSDCRSKGIEENETASILSKRSRKKSFDELKDEESMFLKERKSLKKYDPSLHSAKKLHTPYHELQKSHSGGCQIGTRLTHADHSQSTHHQISRDDNAFLLPDLNMLPCEDDSGPDTLYELS